MQESIAIGQLMIGKKKVMFSDETRINCFGSDGKQYIWRKINEA